MAYDSPRQGKIAAAIALVIIGLLLYIGNPIIFVLGSPAFAVLLAFSVVVWISWLLGPKLRASIHGEGRQLHWGYLGHTVRGEMQAFEDTDDELWISLRDCSTASGLDLERRIDRVAATQKRPDPYLGWLVSREGMGRVLDSHRGDAVARNKLRLFLEREVWQTRKG